jgi:methylenetetrahydrofolate--tRNA-(uracil-5-)-methyltransferase
VLRLIPGLESAKFLRYGQIHRNTYINAPSLLTELLNMKQHSGVFFAGQISGVEGYTESIAMGMLAGMNVARLAEGLIAVPPPRETALGSLVRYICHAEAKSFQPANITFDLLPQLDETTRRKIRDKKQRHKMVCEKALESLASWRQPFGLLGEENTGPSKTHAASSISH